MLISGLPVVYLSNINIRIYFLISNKLNDVFIYFIVSLYFIEFIEILFFTLIKLKVGTAGRLH